MPIGLQCARYWGLGFGEEAETQLWCSTLQGQSEVCASTDMQEKSVVEHTASHPLIAKALKYYETSFFAKKCQPQ
jgi:hypothetical protein